MHVAYIHQHFSTKEGTTTTRSCEMGMRLSNAGHSVAMICGAYDAAGCALAEKGFSRDLLGNQFVDVLEHAYADFHAKKKSLVPA